MDSANVKKAKVALVLMIVGAVLNLKRRKIWAQKRLLQRNGKGCYENLKRELALKDTEAYRRWLRMDTASFEVLLDLVSPLITSQDTQMRKGIPAAEKLALTLRYLSTGESQRCLSFQFQIAQNTISGILKLVCNALVTVLKNHVQSPSTEAEWQTVSQQFENKWQFPMCVGALTAKHLEVSPPNSIKQDDCSMILIALVDANLKFLFLEVGKPVRVPDGKEWKNCKLRLALEKNTMNFPLAQYLPGTRTKAPFVIVSDNTFPLELNIMNPFSSRNLNEKQSVFNYRLTRAWRVAENAFGILGARFQVFKESINTDTFNASKLVLACVSLHNFLIARNSDIYISASSIDEEDIDNHKIKLGEWRDYTSDAFEPVSKQKKKPTPSAKRVRNAFRTYVNGIGAVSWQKDMLELDDD